MVSLDGTQESMPKGHTHSTYCMCDNINTITSSVYICFGRSHRLAYTNIIKGSSCWGGVAGDGIGMYAHSLLPNSVIG